MDSKSEGKISGRMTSLWNPNFFQRSRTTGFSIDGGDCWKEVIDTKFQKTLQRTVLITKNWRKCKVWHRLLISNCFQLMKSDLQPVNQFEQQDDPLKNCSYCHIAQDPVW